MKVLVADDDLDQLRIRCLLLERNGFEILPASDPASALAIAKAEKPDCAVVDLRFPTEESGLRLVRDLKTFDSAIRLILLTGARPSRLASCSEAGLIEEVVEKSLGSANLIRKLKGLERRR